MQEYESVKQQLEKDGYKISNAEFSCLVEYAKRKVKIAGKDESYINVGYHENDFIFRIETDGSMPPKEVLLQACDELGEKADKFIRFSEGGSK